MISIDAGLLRTQMSAVLHEKGVDPLSVHHVTEALVETSLRGTDSHGVNLFPAYCQFVDAGRINRAPTITTVRGTPSTAVIDADHGFGHHAGYEAMEQAMVMARHTGLGAAAVRNSHHFAAASYYGLHAARNGYIGMAFTNADALAKAHGSSARFFGTNPICFCAPMGGEEPMCLDMATTLSSWNKLLNRRRADESLPSDWAFDRDGHPTTDPHQAHSLAPAGAYKGFGLAMMVEMFCSLLADGPLGIDVLPMYESLGEQRYVSHFFLAIDIRAFVPIGRFMDRLTEMAARIRSLPAHGPERVQIPGDPEKAMYRHRREAGIPIDAVKFEEFLAVSPAFSKAA
ncbi:MAG: Ldh family oxidoreductase [Myxococcota bacterium]